MTRIDIDHETGSGNVFADLELADSDELLAKAELARQITGIAAQRNLTHVETARILGTTQPKVSDLFSGKLAVLSMERLIRFLNALDCDVSIVVSPKPRHRQRAITSVTELPVAVGEEDAVVLKVLAPSTVEQFDELIGEARRQARNTGLRPADIRAAVAEERGRD